MRKFFAALGRALAEATRFVWEVVVMAGRVTWALVPKPAPVAPPVSAAEALADALEAEHHDTKSEASGVTHRSPLGVAAAHYARDPASDLSALPDDVQLWLASLSDGERAKMARCLPHQIERHVRARCVADRIPGLPLCLPLEVAQQRIAKASTVRGLKRLGDPDDEPEPRPALAI